MTIEERRERVGQVITDVVNYELLGKRFGNGIGEEVCDQLAQRLIEEALSLVEDPADVLLKLVGRLNRSPARVDEHFPDVLRIIADMRETAPRTANGSPRAEAYAQGHIDRYRRDRQPDVLCRNCGKPWAA